MWTIITFIFMVASPFLFFVLSTFVVGFIGTVLFEALMLMVNIFKSPSKVLNVFKGKVTYKNELTDRGFSGKQGGEILDARMYGPYKAHNEGNVTYPLAGTERYKQAKRLNLKYFTGSSYPLDYIVLGDRALIEQTRKGSILSKEEERLITLGYGYDGKPFGEPWGIEEQCLEDFLYAQEQGDLIKWMCSTYEYTEFIRKGYKTTDLYQGINSDIVANAEYQLKNNGNKQHTRLDKNWMLGYKEGQVKPGFKVASGGPATIHSI